MGLNETFPTTSGNILRMKPFPSLNGIYSLIIQEQPQKAFTCGPYFNLANVAMNMASQSMIRLLRLFIVKNLSLTILIKRNAHFALTAILKDIRVRNVSSFMDILLVALKLPERKQ